MPVFKVEIPMNVWGRLADIAVGQRRPVAWQAEIMLIEAIEAWPAEPMSDGQAAESRTAVARRAKQ